MNKFTTSAGRTIYTYPITAFPSLVANVYFIDDGDKVTLVDTGSGLPLSNQEFMGGFEQLKSTYKLAWGLADLNTILITHGHSDHFGGLPFLRQFTDAPVGIHILDRRVLANYEERLVIASQRLAQFLINAGTSPTYRSSLMAMYQWAKDRYTSQRVDFLLDEGDPVPGDFQVYHVPGHCPGQVCIQVDDILLTADHILATTTPHQAPESITHNMGLGHYLDSLSKIEKLSGIRLGLGGHEAPVENIPDRIQAIKTFHQHRLQKTLDICTTPKSIVDISKELFGDVKSYHVLLALEETGAHVEYLHQRGELLADNVAEIENEEQPVIKYVKA